ncbi:MAG: hypothetical protein IT204_25450 [Fimbriimonadaceae bacterium]|nr:hypothetical protein [Fimbriimonadaceae bacterium]
MPEPILLVDRETNRCRLLQRRLERHGFAVTTVESLEQVDPQRDLPARVLVVDLALLCGPERGPIEELVGQVLGAPTYVCRHCGRRLREVEPGAGVVVCCGEPMHFIAPAEQPVCEEEAMIW